MEFFNRVKETNDIVQMINDNNSENTVIVLFGTTGVGKSGLVDKLMTENLTEYIFTRVRVSRSSPDTIENLHYFNALYKVICELAQKNMFDDIPTPAQQSIKSWKRIFQFAFDFAKAKAGIEADNRLFEPTEEYGVIRKKDYLIYVLKKKSFIITIENVQNIDTQSFEIIFEILKKVSGVRFIFEYTSEPNDNEKVYSFINDLRSANAKIHHYKIEKMLFEEAKKLVPHDLKDYDDHILEKNYEEGHGNLIKMMMADPSMGPEENPIKYSLDVLSKDEKYIVNMIFLNEGKINTVLLFKLLIQPSYDAIQFSYSSLSNLIDELKKRQIINQHSNILAINHDSIIAELENQKPNPILYSAYRTLTNHYNKQKSEFPHDESNIEKLFGLYLKFSDEAIIGLLDELKRMILQYKYPQSVMHKLSYLRDKLISKPNANWRTVYELSLMMLEISYHLELKESAEANLNTIITPGNALHMTYQAGILAMDGSNQENHEAIRRLILQTHEGSRPRLVMELILLAAMMQTCPSSYSKEYAEQLMAVEQYKQFLEYGFLLRNYAELVGTSESIEIYNKCLSFFEDWRRRDLQAQVYISLSMCHTYKGELEIAMHDLAKAVSTTDRPLKEHMLLNNYAVLEMLSGRFSDQVLKDLNDALLLTSSEYESIIIKCNLLIYYVSTCQYKLAKQVCEEIEKCGYEQYQYEELLHIVYQNLMFYYDRCSDSQGREKYANKIKELLCRHKLSDEMKYYAQLMLNGEKSDDFFYTQFPFRADFLGYWEFEINRELENFELAF